MIDFHNHILPNVDDGSKSLEMSLEMLKEAESQGITDIVNTVHYQHPKMGEKEINFDEINEKIKNLQKNADKNNIDIKIHNGSEVFYLPNLCNLIEDPQATIGNGKYMLIEFPVVCFPPDYEKVLFSLDLNGVTPIIAHPERYREIQKNFDIIKKMFYSGYIIQLDAGSLLGIFGRKAKICANKILNHGYFHLIGSDAHNSKSRNFCLKHVLDLNNNILKTNYNTIFIKNPRKILNGGKIENIIVQKSYNLFNNIIDKICEKF